jgi:hypothetical protein
MVVDVGVAVSVTPGVTLTVAMAEAVQVPLPVSKEYVVETVGLTIITALPGGLAPLLAVQV